MPGAAQSKQAEEGCLALLSSCFATRPKARSDAPKPSLSQIAGVEVSSPDIIASTVTATPDSAAVTTALTKDQGVIESQDEPLSGSPKESDLWLEALRKTDDEAKKLIKKFFNHSDDKVLVEGLVAIVREKEEKFKIETPKVTIGDREIIWRDYAKRVVAWMTDIVDITTKFAPGPSSAAWSALKVLLTAHVSQCEDLIAIFGCAEKVLRLVRCGKIYEIVYLQGATDDSHMSMVGLKTALVDVYQKSLELLALAAGRLTEGSGMRFIHALGHPGEGETLVQQLTESERSLAMAVQACEAEHRQIENAKNRELLHRLSEPLRYIDHGLSALLEDMEKAALLRALDFISSTNVGDQHENRTKKRTKGTCKWLLQHKKFIDWEDSSSSSVLWLNGQVGAGKSTLTSKVIDRYRIDARELMDENEVPAVDEGFAFFYCSKSDPDIQHDLLGHTLRSYVRQLATVPHYPSKMEAGLIKLCHAMEKNNQKFTVADCQERLSNLVNIFPRTILILDALDECDKPTRKRLVEFFSKLVQDSKRPIKIFISSREENHIRTLLPTQHLIEIRIGDDNQTDIERFVSEEMKEIGDDWSQEVKPQVKTKLLKSSNGMFRWTYLQMDQLKNLTSDEAILTRLGKLPKTLTAAYNELYNDNKDHDRTLLQRAVKWVMYARTPLSTEQLLSAIRLYERNDDKNVNRLELSRPLVESRFEAICRHLIVKDVQQGTWKFAHASVTEYFEDEHRDWTGHDAQIELAKLSLMVLIESYSGWSLPEDPREVRSFVKAISDGCDPQDPRSHLQQYVRQFWAWHVRATQTQLKECPEVSQLLRRFMVAKSEAYSSSQEYQKWHRHIGASYNHKDFAPRDLEPIENPMFGIWALGLYDTAKDWRDGDINVSQLNNEGLDALALAAKYGHNELCCDLIAKGSDVNRILPNGDSALHEAIRSRQLAIVETLLSKSADPNLDTNVRPVCEAAYRRIEILEILLRYKADPNALCRKCSFKCALEATAYANMVNAADMLIKANAIVNIDIEPYGSPLAAAAYSGSLQCARLLIERGADVNAHLKLGKYGSVLAAALFGWDYGVEMVRYLIEEAKADTKKMVDFNPVTWRWVDPERASYRSCKAQYLIGGGYVSREDLLRVGYEAGVLPNEAGTLVIHIHN